jgi:hypothetical protein
MKIAFNASNAYAVFANCLVTGAQQEMHIATCLAQFCPVKATNGAAADDGDLVEFALVHRH